MAWNNPQIRVPDDLRRTVGYLGSVTPHHFVLGAKNKDQLDVSMSLNEDGTQTWTVTFLKHAINARGVVHGGAIAGIFDSAVVAIASYHSPGGPSVTASLDVNFKRPMATHVAYHMHSWLKRKDGRKSIVESEIRSIPSDGSTYKVMATAEATLIKMANWQGDPCTWKTFSTLTADETHFVEQRGEISPRIRAVASSPDVYDVFPRDLQWGTHFVFGPGASGERFDFRVFYRPKTEDFVWGVRGGRNARGPPGMIHGGAIPAIMDVIHARSAKPLQGTSLWNAISASLHVQYLRPVPLFDTHYVEVRITHSDPKREVLVRPKYLRPVPLFDTHYVEARVTHSDPKRKYFMHSEANLYVGDELCVKSTAVIKLVPRRAGDKGSPSSTTVTTRAGSKL